MSFPDTFTYAGVGLSEIRASDIVRFVLTSAYAYTSTYTYVCAYKPRFAFRSRQAKRETKFHGSFANDRFIYYRHPDVCMAKLLLYYAQSVLCYPRDA